MRLKKLMLMSVGSCVCICALFVLSAALAGCGEAEARDDGDSKRRSHREDRGAASKDDAGSASGADDEGAAWGDRWSRGQVVARAGVPAYWHEVEPGELYPGIPQIVVFQQPKLLRLLYGDPALTEGAVVVSDLTECLVGDILPDGLPSSIEGYRPVMEAMSQGSELDIDLAESDEVGWAFAELAGREVIQWQASQMSQGVEVRTLAFLVPEGDRCLMVEINATPKAFRDLRRAAMPVVERIITGETGDVSMRQDVATAWTPEAVTARLDLPLSWRPGEAGQGVQIEEWRCEVLATFSSQAFKKFDWDSEAQMRLMSLGSVGDYHESSVLEGQDQRAVALVQLGLWASLEVGTDINASAMLEWEWKDLHGVPVLAGVRTSHDENRREQYDYCYMWTASGRFYRLESHHRGMFSRPLRDATEAILSKLLMVED